MALNAIAADGKRRCAWSGNDALYVAYHDLEWGVPVHDDRRLFEFLVLEGAQAGLSWVTILRKRENYRRPSTASTRSGWRATARAKSRACSSMPGIVRNRLKIESAITQRAGGPGSSRDEFGSFDAFLWRFVDGAPIRTAWECWRNCRQHRRSPTR